MSGLDGYRNRVDSLAEAQDDRDAACSEVMGAYNALDFGDLVAAYAAIIRARRHLDALALRIKAETPND